ncbi:MAG TPA: hypothetical protein VEJ16_03275 [Alphaproteobacteria bacterium]|nr:hypothetical protein [Alphaproteobacteria bacterium]
MAILTTFDWHWKRQTEGAVLVNFKVRRAASKESAARSTSTASSEPVMAGSDEEVQFVVRVPFGGKVAHTGFPPEEIRQAAVERAHDFVRAALVLDLPDADLF